MATQIYQDGFFEAQRDGSYRSAKVILPLVFELLRPNSVLDVGCGVGTWLRAAKDFGASYVLGLDGNEASSKLRMIADEEFRRVDFAEGLPSELGRFDLAMSLEVIEHLPDELGRQVIGIMADSSDAILLSAAAPFQDGLDHINCRWPSYWGALLATKGFAAFDFIRPRIWGDDSVEWWYRQNVILFARATAAERLRPVWQSCMSADSKALDRVHPIMASAIQWKVDHPDWEQRQAASKKL